MDKLDKAMKTSISILGKRGRVPDSRDWEIKAAQCSLINLDHYFSDTKIREIYFRKDCILQIKLFMDDSLAMPDPIPEVGGILLGIYREREDAYDLLVELFAPVRNPEYQSNSLLIIGRGFPDAIEEAEKIAPNLLVLGWFHTHPGHKPYLSSTDLKRAHIFFRINTSLPWFAIPLQRTSIQGYLAGEAMAG